MRRGASTILDSPLVNRLRKSTPIHTFVLIPAFVVACELVRQHGALAVNPWGVILLALGYLQYRLAGNFRVEHGGGGPGIDLPPQRLVTDGPYAVTRNPMYLGHLIFTLGLAVTLRSWIAAVILILRAIWFHRRVLADEARLTAQFGQPYRDYMRRVRRWIPGFG